MSYVDQRMGAGRVTSIVIVAILHALLGYVLVTGMAYKVVKKAVEDLKTFDVKEPPPPEETPPPEPQQPTPMTPPPIVAPPPIVRLDTPPPPIQSQATIPPVTVVTPIAPTKPPEVPPAVPRVQPARAKSDLRRYFSDEDYPETALRAEEQGTVRVSIVVGPDGRAKDCSVTASSGSSALDRATCSIIRSRARFTPGTDDTGQPTTSTIASPPIVWRLPKE